MNEKLCGKIKMKHEKKIIFPFVTLDEMTSKWKQKDKQMILKRKEN